MKYIRLLLATLLFFTLQTAAFARIYTIPLYHLKIKAQRSISVIYALDPAHQVLICKAEKFTSPNIDYPLGNKTLHNFLPIHLKANETFEGKLANQNGTIKISNTDFSSVPISCYYESVA